MRFGLLLMLTLGWQTSAAAAEKDQVVGAVKAVSAAIARGEDVSELSITPELPDETVTALKKLKKCRGSAMEGSTLTEVTLIYVCGSARMGRSSAQIPDATSVEMHFEDGKMKNLTIGTVKAVSVVADEL